MSAARFNEENFDAYERDECPNCGAKDTLGWVCVSFSYDPGFSLDQIQCSACGAAYDTSRYESERPSLWDYVGSHWRRPSPHAVLTRQALSRNELHFVS